MRIEQQTKTFRLKSLIRIWCFNLCLTYSVKDLLQPFSFTCIVTTTDSSGCSYADWYSASSKPIRSFLTSHSSRCHSETSCLLDVRTPTNSKDTFILSQQTNRSVLKARWDRLSRADRLWIWPVLDRTEQDKDRVWQGSTGQDEDRRGCFPRL